MIPLASEEFPMLGLFALLTGCTGCSGTLDLGAGPEADARLTSDIYTWECADNETGDVYEGVFSFNVALEYAPDGLQDRALPGGCVYGLSMFPDDAGAGGSDLPGLNGDEPRWSTEESGGELAREAAGFYYQEVLSNVRSCQHSEDVLADGVMLEDAGALTGAQTPGSGEISWVDEDIEDTDGDGNLSFGETVELDWDDEGWDEAWVQIRQERDGESWGTVTCDATGSDGFVVDEEVWSLLNGDLPVEYINLYAGFQNTDTLEMEDGQKIEVVTRGMHVLVVQD